MADVLQEAMLPVADLKTCRKKMVNKIENKSLQKNYVVCWSPGQRRLSGEISISYLTNNFLEIRKTPVKSP